MKISFAALTTIQKYKLISASVIPRPVAFITTLNNVGVVNAAPFSAFNYVSDEPPLIVVGMQPHSPETSRSGELKDTCSNILRSKEFVINFVDEDMITQMVACAADFPSGVSEAQALSLPTQKSSLVSPPHLAHAPIAMECKLWKHIQASSSRSIILGEIVLMHFRDDLINLEKTYIDARKYRPIGRLFASNYVRLTDLLSVPTPTFESFQKNSIPKISKAQKART